MNDDLISVIIPVYNAEKHLEKCINSIIEQTYKNLEIILINDGSTDKSLEICKKKLSKDSRIILVNKKNGGVSSARNKGLDIAKGKYISFIDSDDYLDKNCYKELIENNLDYDIIAFNYYFDYSLYKREGVLEFKNEKFEYELFNKNSIQGYVCNKIYKKSIINKIRFNEKIKICEDLLYNIELCVQNNGIKYKYIKKPYYYYFQNIDSACSKSFQIDITKFLAYKEIISKLEKYDLNLSLNRKIEFIIDFNDYKLLNGTNKKSDDYKIINEYYKKIKKQLKKTNIKNRLKIFLSCYLNKIYHYIRTKKRN